MLNKLRGKTYLRFSCDSLSYVERSQLVVRKKERKKERKKNINGNKERNKCSEKVMVL